MSTDEGAIRDLVDRWHRATSEGDVDLILTLMAEDALFLVPGKPPMEGREAFGEGLRKVLESNRIESSGEIQDLRVSGDLAYALTLLSVRIVPHSGGAASDRSGHTLTICRKQTDGSWVLSRDANLLPPLK